MPFDEALPVVMIEWEDHSSESDRRGQSVHEVIAAGKATFTLRNYGVLIHEDEKQYILAHETRGDSDMLEMQCIAWIFILKATVKRIIRLVPSS